MDIILDQSSESLLCCRVCLLTNCRLYNIHEYKLADTLSRISGSPMFKGRLPQYLCTHCHTLLLKCAKFRMMCLRTERCLKQELLKGELNTNRIRQIDRNAHSLVHLTLTEIEHVDIPEAKIIKGSNIANIPKIDKVNVDDTDTVSIDEHDESIDGEAMQYADKDESSIIDLDATNLDNDYNEVNLIDVSNITQILSGKDAPNIDKIDLAQRRVNAGKRETHLNTVNAISSKKPELKMELAIMKGELKIKVVKDAIDNPSVPEVKTKACKNDVNTISLKTAPKMKTGKENKEDTDISDEDEVPKKVQIQIFKNTQDIFNNPGMLSKTVIKKLRMQRMGYPNGVRISAGLRKRYTPMFDAAKFEREYHVKIVILSKEEQHEEIALRKQTAKYKRSRFPCEDCGRVFGVETSFANHRLRHSASAGDHECDVCHARYNLRRLKSHQESHRMKFICQLCHYVSRTKPQARAHHAMHAGKLFNCPYCGKIFNNHTTCLSHMRIAHPTEHAACDLCGETFLGPRGVYCHKQRAHRGQPFKCETCGATFVSLVALDAHTDLGEHSGCACAQCGESCASETALQAHVDARHPTESHRCEECEASFSSRAAFDNHLRRKHQDLRSRGPRQHQGPAMCEQCGQILQTGALLQRHMNNHLGVKPFSCPQCPKNFACENSLKAHVKMHTSSFYCDQCARVFGNKANLQRHHRVVHLGQRDRFHCPRCPSTTTTRHNLRLHIDAVHNNKGWPKRVRPRKSSS